MVLNTLTVGAAVTPTVIETYFSHYLNRRPLRQKPTAHIGYHEGLQLVREFLHYASNHTVDEIQAFTSQWVPVPHWVKQDSVTIPDEKLAESARLLQTQLGPDGIERIGGKNWWQWRRDDAPLKAEWIEMRKDYHERQASTNPAPERIMLYIHGGAYYFGSVDEHRYQMQRHARKLRARVLAPRYRLSPQFPFPCGLHDSIAAYLWLLEQHDPATIIVAGDSAGGGMVLSMLCTLRDQGIPLPAGGILLSPWVDLTHSFPSLGGDGKFDYIPAHGFVHKPSMTWPPPNADDLAAIEQGSIDLRAKKGKGKESKDSQEHKDAIRGFSVEEAPSSNGHPTHPGTAAPMGTSAGAPPPPDLSITIDGKLITIKDQIQLYAANSQITHPLVSPVLQPTLGGLPPLLVQVGGGELLRDEQIYIAHKAASPMDYLPDLSHLTEEQKAGVLEQVKKYGSTDVKLEIWDDLCHVAPTLSFTRPAKFMYRSIAQFGAWALARAQNISIDIMDDDHISIISSTTDTQTDPSGPSTRNASRNPSNENLTSANGGAPPTQNDDNRHINGDTHLNVPTTATTPSGATVDVDSVGRAGDSLPPFHHHMIRQRISRHGHIRPLEPASSLPCLNLPASTIGVIKEGPVRKWLAAQETWNKKFASEKRKVQRKRIEELAEGYAKWEGERPPPTALAGRRRTEMPKAGRVGRSWALAMWSGWGSKHDETTMRREKRVDEDERPHSKKSSNSRKSRKSASEAEAGGRRGSRHSAVTDRGQTDAVPLDAVPTTASAPAATESTETETATAIAGGAGLTTPNIIVSADPSSAPTILPPSDTTSTRPTAAGIAYPFKLATSNHRPNLSTVTLQSLGI
ncbi:alpha/beta-hydrolase, partial [Saccharata proteae CBS 121410]